MMMANELPEDLVTLILLWLPVVSLLRFKCVCKSWYALISHQNFIRKHLLHKKNKSDSDTQLLLKFRDLFTGDYVVSKISYETLQISLTQPVPPLFSFDLMEGEVFVVGCCNGLVCLHGFSINHFNFVIWNPATKETKVIPESNVPQFRGGYICGIGFGFDAKTNDYKIIKIHFLLHPEPNSRNYAYQKGVYSLSSDSWRKLDGHWEYTRSPFITDDCKGQMTYINGVASWRAASDDWAGVLSFDMSEEVFLETPLPDDAMRNRHLHVWEELFVLNESIGMAIKIWSEEYWSQFHFDIWSLLEVGVKDSWSKLFTIGPCMGIGTSMGIIRPLGFWKNNTMFMETFHENSCRVVLYDPSTKQMTNLQIHPGVTFPSQLVTYIETLVSVKGGNEFEEQDI